MYPVLPLILESLGLAWNEQIRVVNVQNQVTIADLFIPSYSRPKFYNQGQRRVPLDISFFWKQIFFFQPIRGRITSFWRWGWEKCVTISYYLFLYFKIRKFWHCKSIGNAQAMIPLSIFSSLIYYLSSTVKSIKDKVYDDLRSLALVSCLFIHSLWLILFRL